MRARKPALRGLRRAGLLLGLCLLIGGLFAFLLTQVLALNKPTASDHEAMMQMLAQARDPELFGGSEPGRPTIAGLPRPRGVELRVYGLLDSVAQDRVLARLQGPRERQVMVRFYEHQTMLPDPRGGFSASPAKLLREVSLDRSLATRTPKPGETAASPAA